LGLVENTQAKNRCGSLDRGVSSGKTEIKDGPSDYGVRSVIRVVMCILALSLLLNVGHRHYEDVSSGQPDDRGQQDIDYALSGDDGELLDCLRSSEKVVLGFQVIVDCLPTARTAALSPPYGKQAFGSADPTFPASVFLPRIERPPAVRSV
jgi:hypothetical protein